MKNSIGTKPQNVFVLGAIIILMSFSSCFAATKVSTVEEYAKALYDLVGAGDRNPIVEFVLENRKLAEQGREYLKKLAGQQTDPEMKGRWLFAASVADMVLSGEIGLTEDCSAIYDAATAARDKFDYKTAIEKYTAARKCYVEYNREETHNSAECFSALAHIYDTLGDYERALDFANQSLVIDRKIFGESHQVTAGNYSRIGGIYYSIGDYERALEFFNKSLAVNETLGEKGELSRAADYDNTGLVYFARGDYKKALDNFQKSLDVKFRTFMYHPFTAYNFDNVGLAYLALGNYGEALKNFNEALGIRQRNIKYQEPFTALSFSYIGRVREAAGEYAAALVNYQKALDVRLKYLDAEHPAVADSYDDLGRVYFKMKDNRRALEYYGKALSAMSGGKESPGAADCRPDAATAMTFRRMGVALSAAGRKKEAAAAYANAADVLDRIRGFIESESSRKLQESGFYEMYPEGIGAFAALAEEAGGDAPLEQAFEFAEKGIGRVFMDMLGRGRAVVDGGLPRDVVQQGLALRAKLKAARDAVDKEEAAPEGDKTYFSRRDVYSALEQAEADLKSYEAGLLEKYPDYAELMRPHVRSLAEIRGKVFAPAEAALEYYLGEKYSWLILITRDSISIEKLAPAAEIESRVELLKSKMAKPNSRINSIYSAAAGLYDMLIKPVEKNLSGIEKLLIVPTGKLYFLPFEALILGEGDRRRYLIEKYSVRYAPSLNVLYLVQGRRERRGAAPGANREWLAFGDPVYQQECDERARGGDVSDATEYAMETYTRAMAGGGGRGGIWCRLPGTGEEVRAIASQFGTEVKKEDVNIALDATETRFKQLAALGSRFLHAACHGTLGEGGAGQPAVVLSLIGNRNSGEDGFLTMTEVLNMKAPAEMVVLSACRTGEGLMEKGEGVAGMARAFLFAGADSLVVSLWSVADVETRDLMVSFYKKLLSGTDRETALRESKREMIAKGLHPFYWAPFIYIGTD